MGAERDPRKIKTDRVHRSRKPGRIPEPLRRHSLQLWNPQGVNGTIRVIGPKRMEYVAAISGVRHLSAFMSQMVLGIQGNVAE